MKYKVSVIIPVYNVEKYLRQCLDSVVKQTLTRIEIILVDDGSTDSSGKIIDEYGESYENIKVFHKANGGQGSARNLGLKYATGEYVYFVDSDDYLDVNALEMLYSEAKEKQLDVLLFAAKTFTDEKELYPEAKKYTYSRTQHTNVILNGKDAFVLSCEAGEYTCSLMLRFYNGDYLANTQVKFDERYIHEDEDYAFLTLVGAKRVEILDEVLYYRRIRSGSTMTGKKCIRSIEGYIYAFERLKQYYDKCMWSDTEKKILLSFILEYLYSIIFMYSKVDRLERMESVVRIRQVKDILKKLDLKKSNFKITKRLKIYMFLYCEKLFIFMLRIRQLIRR